MTIDYKPEDVKAIECRHVVYCPRPQNHPQDLHVAKQIIHLKDGRIFPKLGMSWDFKRDFYVTKKGKRNHKEKKENESLENLDTFKCTESELPYRVGAAIQYFGPQANRMKILSRSPYVYGTDISSTAIMKHKYELMWPDVSTPMTMAATDTETDMLHGTEEIIMQTISFKDRILTVIKRSFLKGYSDVDARLQEMLHRYLGEDVKERNIKWEVIFVDTAGEIVVEIMKKAHEWNPDFLAIWNIEFDMTKMLEALARDNLRPEDVFSDPSIPVSHRHFDFKLGPAQKIKSDGTATPLTPSQRWHSVNTPCGFSIVDAMCCYRQIRTGSQEEPSYALDAIMEKEIKRNKLSFKEADAYQKGAWHVFMQQNYPLEYVIYNVFDCVGMEILDEKTTDLSIQLAMFAGTTNFARFNSQPTRLNDDYHWHLIETEKHVLASTSDQMKDENDELTVTLKGWITMLSAHQVLDNGLKCVEEFRDVPTNIRSATGDLDVEGSYPNGSLAFNISKSTTKREIVGVRGVTETMRRRQGINLSAGHVNCIEISTGLFKLPDLDQMYASYLRQQACPSL